MPAPQPITDMQLTAVRTLTSVLAAPVLSSSVSGSTATLNWTAPTPTGQSIIAGYRLYKGTTGGTVTTLVGTFTTLATTDALPATQFYRVEAFDQYQTGNSSNVVSCAPVSTTLTAVTNFLLTNQGGATNGQFPVTAPLMQMTVTYGAASGPVHHYRAKLGTNGGAKVTVADNIPSNVFTYTFTGLTNFYNARNIGEANTGPVLGFTTWYDMDIVAVDANGSEGPPPTQFTCVQYDTGVSYCGNSDLSFGLTQAPDYFALDPVGTRAIKFIKGGGGCGLQSASFNPLAFNFGLEVNMFRYFNIELMPAITGQVFDFQYLTRSPVGDVFPNINLSNFANSGLYGPAPVAGQYATYKIPLSALGFGETVFVAGITNGVMAVTSIISGPGIDPTCWIAANTPGAVTTAGASEGVWVSAQPGQKGVGNYTVSMGPTAGTNPPNVPSGTTMVCHKSQAYKTNAKDFTSPSGTTIYCRKQYFTRN